MSLRTRFQANTMSTNTVNGSTGNYILNGGTGEDSLLGLAGDDTLRGGAGNDSADGGSGYNTYQVTGTADAFYWTVNASGAVVLTDAVTDGGNPVDGSDEGIDTLTNIQAIQYVRPDGSIESTVQIDDYGNAPDAGNTQRLCCRNQDGKKSGRRAEVGSRDE